MPFPRRLAAAAAAPGRLPGGLCCPAVGHPGGPAARPTPPGPSGAWPRWRPSPPPGGGCWTGRGTVLAPGPGHLAGPGGPGRRPRRGPAPGRPLPGGGGGLVPARGRWRGVTSRLLARVKEEGLAGVTFTPVTERTGQGALAPHVLGRVGQMSPEEWESYQDQGYAMDTLVGKDGAEAAFEAYLHGTPRPAAGGDRPGRPGSPPPPMPRSPWRGGTSPSPWTGDLQTAAEEGPGGPFWTAIPQATGGALVALDVDDGGVLAMVSQPGVRRGHLLRRLRPPWPPTRPTP